MDKNLIKRCIKERSFGKIEYTKSPKTGTMQPEIYQVQHWRAYVEENMIYTLSDIDIPPDHSTIQKYAAFVF